MNKETEACNTVSDMPQTSELSMAEETQTQHRVVKGATVQFPDLPIIHYRV